MIEIGLDKTNLFYTNSSSNYLLIVFPISAQAVTVLSSAKYAGERLTGSKLNNILVIVDSTAAPVLYIVGQ